MDDEKQDAPIDRCECGAELSNIGHSWEKARLSFCTDGMRHAQFWATQPRPLRGRSLFVGSDGITITYGPVPYD